MQEHSENPAVGPRFGLLEVVVFDLDGVLRHFDREAERLLEVRHDLEPGSLIRAAFGDELGGSLVTGRIDWPEFADRLALRIGRPATDDFLAMRAILDHDAVDVVARLRDTGRPVALLTNGTLRTDEELAEHGLTHAFDAVFNAAVLGVAKPDRAIYEIVTESLAVEPSAIGFVDDHLPNVEAASAYGWQAHLYQDLRGVVDWLTAVGAFG